MQSVVQMNMFNLQLNTIFFPKAKTCDDGNIHGVFANLEKFIFI